MIFDLSIHDPDSKITLTAGYSKSLGTKQESNNKQKERMEKQKRVEYFMKKDIESITKAIMNEFYNNKSRFQCKRHCSEKYIEYIILVYSI